MMTGSTSRAQAVVLDFLERMAWTAGQQFFAVLVATGAAASALKLPWELAVSSAIVAALASLPTTAILYIPGLARWIAEGFWRDLFIRAAKTFLSLAGLSLANIEDWDAQAALYVAVVATVQAIGKGVLSREQTPTPPVTEQEMKLAASTPSSLSRATYRAAQPPPKS
jgi:hypothetical protein